MDPKALLLALDVEESLWADLAAEEALLGHGDTSDDTEETI